MTTVVPTFAATGLAPALLAELSAQGITEPFPIQAATLPDSLAGRDVLGRGRTGSGKTLAFGLPLLHRTAGRRARPGRPLALVLVPTRELAQQVTTALAPYARAVGLRCATVVGGLSLQRQADALRAGAEVVVATPGRLHDLINRGDARLDQVATTALDEADRMADMGFLPQVTKLLEQVAPDGQRMLFSATLDRGVDTLVRRFLTDPVSHSVDPGTATVTAMTHHVLHVEAADKQAALAQIAARDGRTILFIGTKHRADRLARQLLAKGVRAAALHGGKTQPQRTRILEQFRTGQVTALVATDVAARGIHVDGLDLVVNADPPTEAKDYLHRGGRTARAGESGSVVTLVLPEQRRDVSRLMSVAGITPQSARVRPGDEALVRVTGAREPSGVPVIVVAPQPAPAPRSGAPRSRRVDGGRPAGEAGRAGVGGARAGGDGGDPTGARAAHRTSGRSRRPRRPRTA
ncbi:Superfamily II DNA and RNA helicase [Micromonospora rhizosphaerae]|uniref:Superfamily II DNA and RNA helicase n=1 Tax=Micromonospora rhizosphaerae TaxID=568872 RepID=A0A1C6TDE2_9ACTN|nr:DEAD/DEAH box helicase [Micromonospora rhizosphaerae]SCL39778.1 Superfamily II DNA and RNA helicase [Micromonospora rhizosphaerae]